MVSSLGLLSIKLIWRSVNRFLYKHKFSFIWDKIQKYNCESYYSCMFSFVRNYQSVFQSDCIIYILTSNIWFKQLLYFLTNSWCYNSIILRRVYFIINKNCTKNQHDPDNHDGVITHTHMQPDILECEVKWALGSITMNKTSGGDGIQWSYFKS